METFNIKEAAAFLKMTPEGLRLKAAKGEVPAAKIGKCWVFITTDLVVYLRSRYSKTAETSWGVVEHKRNTTCHSIKEEKFGGSILAKKECAYKKALGLPIR